MVIRRATAIKEKLGFLIYGKQGTWKSSLCLEFAKMKREDGKPFRVLYIDAEAGSIDSYLDKLAEQGVDSRNIFIASTQSLTEVRDLIKTVSANEEIYYFDDEDNEEKTALDADGNIFIADAIVVDGLSLLYTARQQGIIEFSKKRANVRAKKKEIIGEEKLVAVEGAGLEQKDYQTLKFNGQAFILDLLASGKHFAVTCREEDVKENVKDKEGNIKTVATGEKRPQGFKDVAYNVKTVLHMLQDEENGDVIALVEGKDRTTICKQNEIIENPTLLTWQPVIDRNKNKKDVTTTNTFNKSVDVEVENIKNDLISDDTEDTTVTEVSADEIKSKISSTLKSLTSTKKAKAKSLIEKAELPVRYNTIDDIDTLNKYLSIIESVI
jgi:hypothetical protein